MNSGVAPTRTTDTARLLLRRAQLALAAFAVVVAVPVGLLVGLGVPVVAEGTTPASAGTAIATTDRAPISFEVAPDRATTVVPAAWTTPVQDTGSTVTEPPVSKPADIAPQDRTSTGVLAAVVTMLSCWALLALAGAVWRARLDARDSAEWERGWSRVEPDWSGRAG